jgi:hypothetical protein
MFQRAGVAAANPELAQVGSVLRIAEPEAALAN